MHAAWDEHLHVTVRDRGEGWHTSPPKSEGWGIGLSLAEAALERLGGHLRRSARDGGGLAVHIAIPLARLKA